jgi:murein DD-endopeptidase MepM/ murein hydrolase activator NlpD
MTISGSNSLALTLNRIGQIRARVLELDPTSTLGAEFDVRTAFAAGAASSVGASGLASPSGASGGFAAALSALAGAGSAPAPTGVGLTLPVAGATVSQPFGPTDLAMEPPATIGGVHYAHFHDGLDLAAPLGSPVFAAAAGLVTFAGPEADGAVVVRIAHGDGSETLYGHLAPDLKVQVGAAVAAGEQLGQVGMTGNTTGPHLHFELLRDGRPVDPAPWLAAGQLSATGATGTDLAASPGVLGAGPAALARFDNVASRIPYAQEIRAAAVGAGVDPLLLASLVRAESNFQPTSVSGAGAIGLTQLMPATAKSLGVADPFDPIQNLRGGAAYLAGDLQAYGRVDLALAAYQAGKGAVRAAGGIPASSTTRGYVATILSTWSGYLEAGR